MPELSLLFILSQILVSIAIIFDFLSFQFKKKQHTFICFIISSSLISAHYFLLGRNAAGVLVFISVLRFTTAYFSSRKKYLFIFVALNTLSLFFTFKALTDLIVYIGTVIIAIANFQTSNKAMRKIMMLGTFIIIAYNIIIYSPMGVVLEGLFLMSNFLGYYRHYIREKK